MNFPNYYERGTSKKKTWIPKRAHHAGMFKQLCRSRSRKKKIERKIEPSLYQSIIPDLIDVSTPLAIGLSSLLFQNRPYCEWNTLWYWVSFVSIISRNGKFQMKSSHTRLHDPLRKRRFSKNAVQTQGLWKPRVCVLMWTKRFWKRSFSKRDDEIRIKM